EPAAWVALGCRGSRDFDRIAAERVAERVHRADEARLAGAVGQRPPQLGDEHGQVRVDDEGPRPQLGGEGLPVQDVRPALDEQPQQVEGLGRQMDFHPALPAEPTSLRVERELGELNRHGTVNLQKPWNFPTTGGRPRLHYRSDASMTPTSELTGPNPVKV